MSLTRVLAMAAVASLLALGYGCKSSGDADGDMIPPATDATPIGFDSEAGGPGSGLGGAGGGTGGWSKDGSGMVPDRDSKDWTPIPGLKFPTVYFAFDQYGIGASEKAKIDQVVAYMNKNQAVGLIIEGHCDERGTEEYNRGLGERRALAIKEYVASHGIPQARLKTVSYGEERPAVQGHNEAAWAKNRRGELIGAKMN
jgi:peptidoglycan-associated lipoprotein